MNSQKQSANREKSGQHFIVESKSTSKPWTSFEQKENQLKGSETLNG